MKLSAFGSSRAGNTGQNHDFFLIDPTLGLYVVCDGLNDSTGENRAARTAAEALHRAVGQGKAAIDAMGHHPSTANSQTMAKMFYQAVMSANAQVAALRKSDPAHSGAMSTIAAILVAGGSGLVAHVGDCRVYLLRAGKLHPLTRDHADQGVLNRALGAHGAVQAELLNVEIGPSDLFLLATKGLWEKLPANEPYGLAKSVALEQLPDRLVELVGGGEMDATAIVVRCDRETSVKVPFAVERKLEAIKGVPIFSTLSFAELSKVLNHSSVRECRKGEKLIGEGETGQECFVLLGGEVEVSKAAKVLARLGPGEFFGEMNLLDGEPRAATVRVLEDSPVLAIAQPDFHALLKAEPLIAAKVLWQFCRTLNHRLRQTNRERVKTLQPPAHGRAEVAKDPFEDTDGSGTPGRT